MDKCGKPWKLPICKFSLSQLLLSLTWRRDYGVLIGVCLGVGAVPLPAGTLAQAFTMPSQPQLSEGNKRWWGFSRQFLYSASEGASSPAVSPAPSNANTAPPSVDLFPLSRISITCPYVLAVALFIRFFSWAPLIGPHLLLLSLFVWRVCLLVRLFHTE